MTRIGKIARLPRYIRHDLNLRLDNGEHGKALVKWLNGLDEVKEVLSSEFDGRPISEQNLSEWKQGGFLEWQRHQAACERLHHLVDFSDSLDDAADWHSIADRLASVLASELADNTLKLLEETTDQGERPKHICKALGQLYTLRMGDQMAERLRMDTQRWDIETEKRHRKETQVAEDEARHAATAPIWDELRRPALAAAFGGGEAGKKAADFILKAGHDFNAPASFDSVADEASLESNQNQT